MAVGEEEEGVLIPLFRDPDDSGIDSDRGEPRRGGGGRVNRNRSPLPSETSSDDDYQPTLKPPAWAQLRDAREQLKSFDKEGFPDPDHWSHGNGDESKSPDRNSPLLFEVELTASDEDDDTSVFELVIPVPNRYKRVPTAPPKSRKGRLVFFCSIFCCFRKCF